MKVLWTPKGWVTIKAKVGFQPPVNRVIVKDVRRDIPDFGVQYAEQKDPERERALRGA